VSPESTSLRSLGAIFLAKIALPEMICAKPNANALDIFEPTCDFFAF